MRSALRLITSTVAVLALAVGTASVDSAAATTPATRGAGPGGDTSVRASGTPSAHAQAEARRLRRAVAAGSSSVLIVHVAGGSNRLHAAIRTAQAPDVTLRHTLDPQTSFSVQVPTSDEHAAIAKLRAEPGVTAVEKSVTRRFTDVPAVPDDSKYGREKSYFDAVSAPAAWQSQHGSAAVKIAVIDSGIDVSHPDLAKKIVATHDATTGGSQITDRIGHGTFVAGVAAADTDNGLGIAGAGYDTSIIGVKIAGPDGSLSIDDEVAGIRWAVANGANIINLSLSGPDYSASEKTAIEYAIHKGVLVVAAAGNDANSVKQYPAAYAGVIAVGATDPAFRTRADFSSYGSWVTLAAPGVGIYSTTPLAGSVYFETESGYAAADGTSFSAPLVAGEAALLEAVNPSLTVSQVRAALIASASGYPRLGLGAGQVDFAAALAHVAPTGAPGTPTVTGTRDTIHFSAASAASSVAFRVDSEPALTPVPVIDGTANLDWPSAGFADGPHTLHAVNCTEHGECGDSASSTTFSLTNPRPKITAPTSTSGTANPNVTGNFTVTGSQPGGGALRLQIDGNTVGYAGTPYTFLANGSALTDGTHRLVLTVCSLDHTHCAGPSSMPLDIDSDSLHPTITSLRPSSISPDGDRVQNATALRFALTEKQSVLVETVNSAGTVVRTAHLGVLGAGDHLWVWRGQRDGGAIVPDGSYQLDLITSATDRSGYAAVIGQVDTHAPTLRAITARRGSIYPVRDGYRDTFAPRVALGDTARLVLSIDTTRGRIAARVAAERAAGVQALTWDGRDAHRRIVRPGRYTYHYTAVDAAGNRRETASRRINVSAKRLVTRTATINRRGAGFDYSAGTSRCSTARTRASAFRGGVQLVNGCRPSTGDLAFATYTFRLPKVISYRHVALLVYGRSRHRPSELTAALQRSDGGVEIVRYVRVTRAGDHWYTIASASAQGHVSRSRRVQGSVILDSAYSGVNDFDIRFVRLSATYRTLR